MTSPIVTTVTVPPAIQEYYDRVLLKRALPFLVHTKWAQKRPIEKGSGKQIRFRKYNSLAPALQPLDEGITPVGSSMTYTDVTATLNQYGDFITISDVVTLVSPDKILTEAVELLGEQEGETIDLLMRNILSAGTSVVYANNVTSRAEVAKEVQHTDLDKIVRALKRNNVRPVTRLINPSTGVGTIPVPRSYWAITHPDVGADLMKLEANGFIPVEKYPNQATVLDSEIGAYKGIRFVETTNAKVFPNAGGAVGTTGLISTGGTNVDVYTILVFGAEAYGESPLSGSTSGVIIKAHSPKDTFDVSDPLNQRSTAGWKALWTGAILQDDWIIRYECGAKA